ncbi:MAG: 1-acyl-sn-glycerol-3-phosphate acyltransferase [Aliivibrio sp.]|uniref:lysophospholipid acyltransferase family protein n=1 Tax=Aliivibrio sp. TaxID=1872443 RepID=UPI001A475C87|nr:1-acyl-sn-glycerol-3-phosphate acyltransferase [Aliivibrio sp.]
MFLLLSQGWRVFATGLCFIFFGIGALCLAFIFVPLQTLTIKDKSKKEHVAQSIIQKAFLLFCQTMKFCGAIDYQFIGTEKLKSDKGCLIVANHPSLIDYVLIGSQLPQCDCLVKASIWDNFFIKGIVKAAGYIPNINPEQLLDSCSERLGSGNLLLVFPEGTRTKEQGEIALQRGASQIAVRTETDLRVIHISVSPSFLTKEKRWYQVPTVKPMFTVEVKERIVVKQFIEDACSLSLAARALNKHLNKVLFP